MDDITAFLVAGSAVLTLLLVIFVVGGVIFARRNDASPDPDSPNLLRNLDGRGIENNSKRIRWSHGIIKYCHIGIDSDLSNDDIAISLIASPTTRSRRIGKRRMICRHGLPS